jgi:hypothetical protein
MSPTSPDQAPTFPQGLIQEIEDFQKLCDERYRFNSHWDTILNAVGVAVSLGIVAAGVYKKSEYAALLGGLITAIISAQRAFPFGQRWQFYRLLNSQAENLLMEAKHNVIGREQAIAAMKAMRLDFAQQIPRGSSFQSTDGGETKGQGDNSADASAT